MSFLAAAGWTLLVRVLFEASVLFTEAARPGAISDLVSVAACNLLAYAVAVFAILRVHEPDTSMRQALGVRQPSVVVLLLSTVVGAALAAPSIVVDKLFAAKYPYTPQEQEQIERLYAAPTLSKKVFLVVAMVVVIPIWDEIFFRGALFTQLKRGRRLEYVVVATAVFDTLMETGGSSRAVVSMMVVSLVLSWIRALSGSMLPSLAARVAFFAVSVVPEALGHALPITRNAALISGAVAALALGAAAAVGRRDPRTLDARLDDG
jgi:membrane protease YdiL (CAAX protease family)